VLCYEKYRQRLCQVYNPARQIKKDMQSRFRQILAAVIVLTATVGYIAPVRADTGAVSVTVCEAGSDAPLPCRAWVNIGSERLFKPITESCTPYGKDRSFSCDGYFVIEVPVGKVVIHVERGKEYRSVDKEVIVNKNQTTEVKITLKRWVNMSQQGWYSCDLHCHFGVKDIRILKQLALADDINLEPILNLWITRNYNPQVDAWPEWPEGTSVYADTTHLVTMRNQEIERIWGEAFESIEAMLMYGLTRPVYIPDKKVGNYPCNAMLAQEARKSSPQCVIDTDKPIWGENVVGMALGLFDSVQVCHNHYHRESTMPWCCGMAGADIEEEQKDWGEDELFYRTNSTYYRFLNCGFKLAVTGGSAMGVLAAPLGYSRTYARLEGPLTEANYLKAIRAGRTFATSGPMLILTADRLDSGAEIRYSTSNSKAIDVKAELRSIQPIDSLELIYNGKVVKKISLKGRTPAPVLKQSIALSLRPQRSGWVAARAIFTNVDGRLRQAHTSPVYIVVDGKATASKRDAEYMIRWIDRIMEVSEQPDRYQCEEERAKVQAVFRQAKQIYQNIAQTAVNLWGKDS